MSTTFRDKVDLIVRDGLYLQAGHNMRCRICTHAGYVSWRVEHAPLCPVGRLEEVLKESLKGDQVAEGDKV